MNKQFYHILVGFSPKTSLLVTLAAVLMLSSCGAVQPAATADAPTLTTPTQPEQPTAQPTPFATSIPSRLDQPFEQDLLEGNYETIFDQIPFSSQTVQEDPSALLVLGKSYYLRSNYTFALETLTKLVTSHPNSPESFFAWYLLGNIFTTLERYTEAADAYTNILGVDHSIGPLIIPKLADSYSYDGQYDTAIQMYQQALIIDPTNPSYKIKIGRAQMFKGDYPAAVTTFQEVYNSAADDYTKAQVNHLMGQVYVLMEDFPSAYARWQENVEKYPLSADTFNSLVGLISYEQPVDQFSRGLVDHFAGKHDIALIAFDEYLISTPEPDPAVYYYIGLSQREQGNYDLAIKAFDKLITDHPDNQYFSAAWDEKAYTYWAYLDDYPAAWQTLETYAINYPQTATASNYLFEAGRIHERGKDLPGAAALWESLPIQFPDSTQRYDAMFQAGIARYRAADYENALTNFTEARGFSIDKAEQVKAMFWEAKTQDKLGKSALAAQTYQSVNDLTPYEYYGLRARDTLTGEKPFARFGSDFTAADLAAAKPEADQWLRILLDLPKDQDLTNLGAIQESDNFNQGIFLWNCGLYQPARQKFSKLWDELGEDAASNYRFANHMLLIGNYADARVYMARTLSIIGYSDLSLRAKIPAFFNKIIYAIHFEDQILTAANKYDLDPFFLTAMAWQESAFDPTVRSSSGAMGLLQIMPFTGVDVASRSGLYDPFTVEMLYDPDVNLNLGAYYINSNLNYLGNDPFAALAGYNAGPGNAMIWRELANGDLDLELEIIRYGETRQYIKGIYTAFELYELFYK